MRLFSEAPPDRRIPGLDTLRGLLVMAVACYHLSMWTSLTPSGSWANMSLAKLGNFGVSAFFLLSGFLAFRLQDWEKLKVEGFGRYGLKRFLRLAPIFYLAVVINIVFGLGMGPSPNLRMIVENFTLCFGAIHPNHALVIGGWYVGLVVLFYAAYPLLAWASARGGWLFLLLATLLLWLWSLPYSLHHVPEALQSDKFHLYVQPGNQLFLMMAGGLLAEMHRRIKFRLAPPLFFVLATLLMTVLLWPAPRFYNHLDVLMGWVRYGYLLLVAALVFLFALQGWALGPMGKILLRLGAWSYGIYLLHPFVYRLVTLRLHGAAAFCSALGLSILAAAIAERWIERPLVDWGRRLSKA